MDKLLTKPEETNPKEAINFCASSRPNNKKISTYMLWFSLLACLFVILAVAPPVWAQTSMSATYTEGSIISHVSLVSASSASDCPGKLSISIPEGKMATTVDVAYELHSLHSSFNILEARSILECTTSGIRESELANTEDVPGTTAASSAVYHSRTGLNIAEGEVGMVEFELHVFYHHDQYYNCRNFFVAKNNSWVVTVHLEDDLRWYPDADADDYVANAPIESEDDLSSQGYYLGTNLPNTTFDCNDSDSEVHPGIASEILGDGKDNDCNSSTEDILSSPLNNEEDCGQALSFDGSNDFVDTGVSIDDQSFTLEAWTKLANASGANFIFGGGFDFANNGLYVGYSDENTMRFSFYDFGTLLEADIAGADTEWHHVAFTFDKENSNTMKIYFDGQEIGSKAANSVYLNSGPVHIGKAVAKYYDGLMDEVKIWNRPLTALEVAKSASQVEIDDEASALLAHYDFNNQKGSSTVTDNTSNENDGVLTNMDISGDWVTEDGSASGQLWYTDTDNDGFVGTDALASCLSPGEGYYLESELAAAGKALGDCNDDDQLVHPDNSETHGDGIDNDCNPATKDIPDQPVNNAGDCRQTLAFDGSDDYVDTEISITDQSFTLEAWTKLTDVSTASFIFGGGSASNDNGLFAGYLNKDNIRFSFYGSGTDLDGVVSNPDTEWHHMAFTFDKENNNTMKIYFDGVELSDTEGSSTYQNSGTLKIGRTAVDTYYNGLLDEVKVWNRPLSALEVAKSASNLEVGDEVSALLAHFDFNNQVSTTTLTDISSNGNDGTLTNMDANSHWVAADGSEPGLEWYADADGDGYIGSEALFGCEDPSDAEIQYYTLAGWEDQSSYEGTDDCDDNNAQVHPDATEIENNGLDDDCNPETLDVLANSLYFDGINDQITLESALPIGGSSHTLEVMIKLPDSESFGGVLLGNGDNSNSANWEIYNNGTLRLYWNEGEINHAGVTDLRDNEWHHIAFVRNKEADTYKAYIDGVEEFNVSGSGDDITLVDAFVIGADYSSSPNYFKGYMDELRVWDVAKSQVDLINAKDCQVYTGENGLVAYYSFNQGESGGANTTLTTLQDETDNGYEGTLTNFALEGANSNWIADSPLTTFCNGPELGDIDDKEMKANTTVSFAVVNLDEESTLSFVLDATSISKGMSIGETSGVFSWVPTFEDIGTHQVTITAENELGIIADQSFNVTVQKVEATVTITNLNQTTDGLAKEVNVATSPEGLSVSVTYNGEQTAPSVAGSYEIEAIINETNYQGSAKATLVLTDPSITAIKDEPAQISFNIYPIPARSSITIKTEDNEAHMIRLYDFSGHLKKEEIFDGTKHILNLQQQSNGIFLLVVSDESGSLLLRRKVIKE